MYCWKLTHFMLTEVISIRLTHSKYKYGKYCSYNVLLIFFMLITELTSISVTCHTHAAQSILTQTMYSFTA